MLSIQFNTSRAHNRFDGKCIRLAIPISIAPNLFLLSSSSNFLVLCKNSWQQTTKQHTQKKWNWISHSALFRRESADEGYGCVYKKWWNGSHWDWADITALDCFGFFYSLIFIAIHCDGIGQQRRLNDEHVFDFIGEEMAIIHLLSLFFSFNLSNIPLYHFNQGRIHTWKHEMVEYSGNSHFSFWFCPRDTNANVPCSDHLSFSSVT